jgi:hypothetical protein
MRRYDGHVFVSLPNAPAALETQPEGDRIDHIFGLGGRERRRKFMPRAALGQRPFHHAVTSPSQVFDDPPSGDRGHDLVRVPDPLPAGIAQRKRDGVGEVARIGGCQRVGVIGHLPTIAEEWERNKNHGAGEGVVIAAGQMIL